MGIKEAIKNFGMKKTITLLVFFIIALLILTFVYAKFIYAKTCDTDECFNSALSECKRTTFVKDLEDTRWYYKIQGRALKGDCIVSAELSQIKKGNVEIIQMEGKSMDCYLPYGLVMSPQQNIEICHGLLKEEIQSVLIKKMHSYLLENIGQISEEFQEPFS